jgi:serine/threonine protein phosphatase PrpC
MVRFETQVLSSAGGRKRNEDVAGFQMLEEIGCWALADGLGGHGGGALAAKLAVEAILESFRAAPACAPERLRDYFNAADAAIRRAQQEQPRFSRMGATAVVLLSDFQCALWGHVGDSRLYYFEGGKLAAQTRDHSVPQALCNAGEITAAEIRFHEDRNRLLRSLGGDSACRPSIEKPARPVAPGDAFLLCTDGFWEYVTEAEMEQELVRAAAANDWLDGMEQRLKLRARGEHDNYSAVAIRAAS